MGIIPNSMYVSCHHLIGVKVIKFICGINYKANQLNNDKSHA